VTNKYTGDMTRAEAKAKLARLAERMGVRKTDIQVRSLSDDKNGMEIVVQVGGVRLARVCDSQESGTANMVCLVLWLEDLVRNIERRIETVREAFYADGGHALPADVDQFAQTAANLYTGEKTLDDARVMVQRASERLGLGVNDVQVRWNTQGATITFRLPSGQYVQKTSNGQVDTRSNVVALALWLQSRAKNFERGIERDLARLFAGNLLLTAG
jgi:hypothetical protein